MDVNQQVKEVGCARKMTIYAIFGDWCRCVWKDDTGLKAGNFRIAELRPWVERKSPVWKPTRRAWRETIYQG